MNCQNCGAKLSCGCQKRAAKDGTPCCTKCVDSVNSKIGTKTVTTPTPDNNLAPTINKVVYKK